MASLKNVRHEKFAQCVASGLSGAEAYRQAAEYSGKQADGNVANWMKRPGVRERIEALKAESAAKTNAMFAGTHARGGANSFLWVSEWGVIQASDRARSEEILTGALLSVGDGVCVVETGRFLR